MEKQKLISTIEELNKILKTLYDNLDRSKSSGEYFEIMNEIQSNEAQLEDLEDDLLYFHKNQPRP